jgi:hypothetical protein
MQRDGQDGRVVVEGRFRAVAVVDVPVDDGHALEPAGLPRMVRRDRGVAEQAEAHAHVADGVVAGRAHEGEGVADRPVEDGVDGRDDAARREERHLVGPAAERRRAVAPVSARRADSDRMRSTYAGSWKRQTSSSVAGRGSTRTSWSSRPLTASRLRIRRLPSAFSRWRTSGSSQPDASALKGPA